MSATEPSTAAGPSPAGLYRLALTGALAAGTVAILAIASLVLLTSAIGLQQTSAASLRSIETERSLVQTIAALSAQYRSGEAGVRTDLRAAIGALTQADVPVAAGTPIVRYLADARRLDALAPGDPQADTVAAAIRAARRPIADRLAAAVHVAEARTQAHVGALRAGSIVVFIALSAALVFQAAGAVAPALRRSRRLAADFAALNQAATTDPLTGTLNRRSFQDRGAVEIHKANRYQRPLSLLMIDPDQLDPINKAHGNAAGDTILKALSELLFSGTRVTDLVGRVGGEEFAILLPETDLAGAELLAERLRRRIGDLSVPIDDAVVTCTVSIGVTAAEKDAAFFGPTLARADAALYEAKMRGRNRVYVNIA